MAGNSPQAPVIIIRKKKGGHGGHHGGAWKVAYADFVTAMMSFFLLLWLLNVTTDIERKGIADYFAPASISKSESGAGGVMGGQSITVNGAQISEGSPPTTQDVTVPTIGRGEEGDEETRGGDDGGGDGKAVKGPDGANPNPPGSKNDQSLGSVIQQEEDNFKQASELLMQAIISNPELKDFANQIVIDRTPEGLRIQITDRDKLSMFPSGGAIPYEKARDLLLLVGKVIAKLPNQISVTGHTDSAPFQAGSGHDNWTLSTARANVSREYLVNAGVDEKRIARVSGLADRDPFVPNDTKDSRNRRISIVLLRQNASDPAAAAAESAIQSQNPAPAATAAPASDAAAPVPAAQTPAK